MKRFVLASIAALASTGAASQDQPATPLDPAAVARQLYLLSDRSWGGAGSYTIQGDGSVRFYVQINPDVRVYGVGRTAEDALADLRRQSDIVANNLVPNAEAAKSKTLSVLDGIKAMLFGERKSQ